MINKSKEEQEEPPKIQLTRKCGQSNKVDAAYYHKGAVNLGVPDIPHFYSCHICQGVEEEEVSVEFINEKWKGNNR